jgi:phytoene synthase
VTVQGVHYETFKRGSKTYFNSSLFFPPEVRRDVFALYGFVRVADDYVDAVPQDADGFRSFRDRYRRALRGEAVSDPLITAFVELARRKGFDPAWSEAFLRSMEMDLGGDGRKQYDRLEDTLEYIYGSAEVIGLFMSKIMDLPLEAYFHAGRLGRAMQYINFIRDIDEDRRLGRRYLPLEGSGLHSLEPDHVRQHPAEFAAFLERHLELYRGWQREAEEGYRFLPRPYRIPIKTAGDMYNWTARVIQRRPLVVFERQVKPSRGRILLQVLANALRA